ncbi:MAG: choice-of-anchor Q domain-containing protein, partial [Acidobacteriota bacterium]|nr:choice-of-anchor Q domain-containing protein [Acidobacteriota bacterium]
MHQLHPDQQETQEDENMKKSFTGPNWKKGSGNSPSAISHSSWPWYGRATAVVLLIWLLPIPPMPVVHAATFTVNTLDDTNDGSCNATHCSLREAINAANGTSADDTITFSVSGTITLSSTLPNIVSAGTAGKLTIDGVGRSITVSGNNSVRVFFVNSDADLTLKNLTVANGRAVSGSGIHNDGRVTIQNSTLSGNSATNDGGSISNLGTATIQNTALSSNSASYGGAISNARTLTIIDSTISANSAAGFGGTGGGIYNYNRGTVMITNSTISNNTAAGVVLGNPYGSGGGISSDRGTVTIQNSMLSGNWARDDGGAILNNPASSMMIKNSTISDNSTSIGGAIENRGTMTIASSLFSGNSATNTGGVIHNIINRLTITNSTFSDNSAVNSGGVISHTSGTVSIINSTLSGNSAGLGGGIRYSATVNIKNSIVGNSPTGGDCSAAGGTLNVDGTNFDTSGSCPGFTQVTSMQLNLGPLADNGGPTQTHALLPGSVAIDAVSDCTDLQSPTPQQVTTDQRGVRRPLDGDADGTPECDVGAYEAPCPSDLFPPILTCPPNRTVQAGASCVASVSVGRATAIDNCTASPTVVGTRSDGMALTAPYPLGVTNITWAATDTAGN